MDASMETVEDYSNLKETYLRLKEEHEAMTQELHECKRNLKSTQLLQQDYHNEIGMLQSQEISQKQKYQEIIKQLERTMNNMRDSHNEEKHALENVIMKMEEKIETMKCGINVDKGYNITTNFDGDTSGLIEEILSDTPEYYEIQELKSTLSELMQTNESLEKRLEEQSAEIENLKEIYESKRGELLEANASIQALTDDNMCLKAELDSLKNQPLNKNSKGNSLFAEVDDRRVYLQDKIKKMNADYVKMVQERAELLNTVHNLKLENLRLLEKWRNDLGEMDGDEDNITCSLMTRIKHLEEINEKYKKDLAQKPVVISKKNFEEYEYFEMVVAEKNKEISSLRDKLSQTSVSYMSFAEELKKAHEEKRKWKLEAMTKDQELDILRQNINSSSVEVTNEIDQNHEKNSSDTINKKRLSENKNQSTDSEIYKNPRTPLRERSSDVNSENSPTDNTKVEEPSPEIKKDKESFITPKERSSTEQASESICDNKENTTIHGRKVTFAANTLSPKRTGRRNCKVIISKPIQI